MSAAAVPSPAPKKPETLADLYILACAVPGRFALQDWIFLEARAKGDLVIAERALRELEQDAFCVKSKAWAMESEAARIFVLQNGPNDIEFGRAQQLVSDAAEKVSACARMIELLSRRQGGK